MGSATAPCHRPNGKHGAHTASPSQAPSMPDLPRSVPRPIAAVHREFRLRNGWVEQPKPPAAARPPKPPKVPKASKATKVRLSVWLVLVSAAFGAANAPHLILRRCVRLRRAHSSLSALPSARKVLAALAEPDVAERPFPFPPRRRLLSSPQRKRWRQSSSCYKTILSRRSLICYRAHCPERQTSWH
eukprot:scaffold35328_cov30-Tisochrysis_lutea.AAC.2